MATEVKLPNLGEGVEDATISRWRAKEGDEVKAGDVILEVATDKVDTEVTAPVTGKLLKINAHDGELVNLDKVLALIGAAGESLAAPAAPPPPTPTKAEAPEASPHAPAVPLPQAPPASGDQEVKATPVARRVASERGVELHQLTGSGPGGVITKDDVLNAVEDVPAADEQSATGAAGLSGELADVASLSVRRLAAEHNLNLAEIAAGRPLSTLTRYDLLSAAASRTAGKPVIVEPRFLAPAPTAAPALAAPTPTAPSTVVAKAVAPVAPLAVRPNEQLIPHSRMRSAVARNTSASAFSAPHVTSMWDVDMSAVLTHRKANKKEFEKNGVNLTVTAYLIQAIVAGLKAAPAANATWTDEGVLIKRYYNIGMAVALPSDENGLGGLIVPVIKQVENLNLLGIARAVNELAEKARANQLNALDLQEGTFTLSNYGTSGSRFQTPIIVQPQVGILGTGAIEKRPVVVSNGSPLEANLGDYLTFKPMMTLGFSYDHRVLDGATADAFCAVVKRTLEGSFNL